MGWKNYDEQYRLRKAHEPSSLWSNIDNELWLLYMQPVNTISNVSLNVSNSNIQDSSGHGNKCYSYNYEGSCWKRPCFYSHLCLRCNGSHPIINCQRQLGNVRPHVGNTQYNTGSQFQFRAPGAQYRAGPQFQFRPRSAESRVRFSPRNATQFTQARSRPVGNHAQKRTLTTNSINETHFRTTNLGETEETHTTDDETERNTINIEHISTIVDTSRTKQRTTDPLKVNETDKSALMWTRDIEEIPGTSTRGRVGSRKQPRRVQRFDIESETNRLINCSLAPNTIQAYQRALNALAKFRDSFDLDHSFPIPLNHITQFIAYMSCLDMAPSTVKCYISAISFYNKINNYEDMSQLFVVRKMIDGMARSKLKRPDSRLPMTVDYLLL
ncbi:unnamed protein product [Mytilus edulis]|uniref:Core-binding (CB) domain-containing protein n=1 Tax=Mytilus edulis TaxID=6550 RepID=A0A8S3T0R7_MYTED|nr:unnamed protein product [Mytilus edulis]